MPKLITLDGIQKVKTVDKIHMDADAQRIQDIVTDISKTLLREKAQLTAEVESGLLDRSILEVEIVKIIDKNGYRFYNREELIEKVFDWMFGYGPLQVLVDDPDISDIDFTRYNYCTVKINGIPEERKNIIFPEEKTFEEYVIHIISRRGGIINLNNPHCRVADYANRLRINGSIWPRNVTGAALQIRKHPKVSPNFPMLIEKRMLNKDIKDFFTYMADSSARYLITGKGGSGKTTLHRAILNTFNSLEKVLLAESDTEIFPDSPSVIVQKIKKKNEGGTPVTLQDLINDGLTMSLNTYCIGEMVGPEAWVIISAGLNGHRWCSTAHANSIHGVFPRLLTMVKQANVDLNDKFLYKLFCESLDIVIHMGPYKVVEISEITGFDEITGEPEFNKLFEFRVEKILSNGRLEGDFVKVGSLKGRLAEEFCMRGYKL